MIAVDTNVLVYAHRAEAPDHPAARKCLEQLGHSPGRWTIPWPCVHEFLAIVTHPRIWVPPTPLDVALDAVQGWFESSGFEPIGEGPEHLNVLAALLTSGQVTGPRIHDGRVAAICESHGVHELWTADRDFGRFSIRTVNPFVQKS